MAPDDTPQIRPAGPDDVGAVIALEATCLGADAWSGGLVREGVLGTLPTLTYLVAVAEGHVVGHAVTSAAGDIAELQRIAVLPDHRRRRTGAALLEASVVVAARTQADRMLLEVRADNRGALAFYAAQGFVEIDRRSRYYGDGGAAIVMRRTLGRGCGAS